MLLQNLATGSRTRLIVQREVRLDLRYCSNCHGTTAGVSQGNLTWDGSLITPSAPRTGVMLAMPWDTDALHIASCGSIIPALRPFGEGGTGTQQQ